MNHYAVENLFGIEGLNIAWYGIIITFGMILGFMGRKRKETISEVMFSYIGTDAQFDEFLKMLVHDYLSVDQPYTKSQEDFVDHVDSCCA